MYFPIEICSSFSSLFECIDDSPSIFTGKDGILNFCFIPQDNKGFCSFCDYLGIQLTGVYPDVQVHLHFSRSRNFFVLDNMLWPYRCRSC